VSDRFVCPVERQTPSVKHEVLRSGKRKPYNRHGQKDGYSWEYVCACGYVGWTKHPDILGVPLMSEVEAR